MTVTVKDLRDMPSLRGMKLIAGESGLGNIVTKCGFLDYEYDIGLKEKYFHRHFEKGQFVLTSFLYAKDNEHSVLDAVKRLHSKECSGLAIKNIYKLNLKDSVMRFADVHHFPIFLISDSNIYFEDFIFTVTERIRQSAAVNFGSDIVNRILYTSLDDAGLEELARALNPSFYDEIAAIYFHFKSPFSAGDFLSLKSAEEFGSLLEPSDAAFYYKNGFMLVHSHDINSFQPQADMDKYIKAVRRLTKTEAMAGVSSTHHSLSGIKEAVTESLQASLLPPSPGGLCRKYDDLGVFKIYFILAGEAAGLAFSNRICRLIQAYDAENNASLVQTAQHFVLADGDIKITADRLGLHTNTVRYRLEALSTLINENILSKAGYELFSAAIKIGLCKEALDSL